LAYKKKSTAGFTVVSMFIANASCLFVIVDEFLQELKTRKRMETKM
jgi:hypothetical protein